MARKAPAFLKTGQKEFAKAFSALCDRQSSWQAWADFVDMAAIAISNAVDPTETRAKREQRYMDIIARYTPAEQKVFPELVKIMVDAMEANQNQDFLGDLFMALELGSHWKGQFFTPYDVCRCMAEIQIPGAKKEVEKKGWIGINDPACGAGALLIAARNVFVREGIGSDQALFVAQDIDHVAGLMCYIQLSLLGCAGYVVIADSLLYPIPSAGANPLYPAFNENHDVWFTPMWYSQAWTLRRMWYSLDLMFPSRKAPAAPAQQIEPPAAETQQKEPEPTPPEEPAQELPPVAVGEQLRLF